MRFCVFLANSGGHIVPGLALADYLQAQGHGVELIAADRPASRRLLKGRAATFIPSAKVGFKTVGDSYKLRSASLKADALIGFGGYLGVCAYLQSVLTGRPLFQFEANSTYGSANRLGRRRAKKTIGWFDLDGAAALGSPAEDGLTECRIKPRLSKVLLLGGSLGSKTLREIEIATAAELTELQFTLASGLRAEKGSAQMPNLREVPFVDRHRYRDYDLIVARAGGTTIAELARIGMPAILIPSPYVKNDHQRLNAEALRKRVSVPVVEEKEGSAGLVKAIKSLTDSKRRLELHQELLAISHRDVCKNCVRVILEELKSA